ARARRRARVAALVRRRECNVEGVAMAKSNPAEHAEMELRRVALSYPSTSEHFPWAHRTIKVRDKAFVFMASEGGQFSFTAKLPDSRDGALMLAFVEPTGYGLGKGGWVTATFDKGQAPPVDMLTGWLDESFRAVAPAKLVKQIGTAS